MYSSYKYAYGGFNSGEEKLLIKLSDSILFASDF